MRQEAPDARGPLDAAAERAFFRDGFLVLPGVFTPRELRGIRCAFDRLERTARRLGRTGMHRGSLFVLSGPRPGTDPRQVRIERIVWCGAAEPTLAAAGRDPRLTAPAAALLGSRRMEQLINQAHFKLPGDGVEFAWHQDSTHRRYGRREWSDVNGRGSYVQTVLAVDEMTADNGPLQFARGSCRLGHVEPPGPDGRLPAELVDAFPLVTVTATAGSVVLFGPYTFHRSGANRSDRPRRALINGFAYPGANARVYPGRGAGRIVVAP